MKIHYVEIVTRDVDAAGAAYAATTGVAFGVPYGGLGDGGIDARP